MNPWSHLHNARHIDWVLNSLKKDPDTWELAWRHTRNTTDMWGHAWESARNSIGDRVDQWDIIRDKIWARCGGIGVFTVVMTLIAYDDCEQYLSMSYEQLHAWALLSETPQAILLLPLKWIQEQQFVSI